MTTQGSVTIYNKRLGKDRRDIYYPTELSAASYAESKGSSHSGGGETTEGLQYRLRIPVSARATDGRIFVSEAVYKVLSDAQAAESWTISKLDLVTRGAPLVTSPSDERTIRDAAAAAGVDVIIIEEYADNTGRGSPAVQHWRIGGR